MGIFQSNSLAPEENNPPSRSPDKKRIFKAGHFFLNLLQYPYDNKTVPNKNMQKNIFN